MTNEQMRADFEAECRRYWGERCPDLTFVDGNYENNGRADLAWRFYQAATAKANQWQPIDSLRRFDGVVLMWNETANAVHAEKTYRIGHPIIENTTNCTHWQPLPLPPTGTEKL